MQNSFTPLVALLILSFIVPPVALAGQAAAARPTTPPQPAPAAASQAARPADYVIGTEDVLGIVFWREPDMSGDVTVRPDGRITIPVVGEMQAAGRQPEQLQKEITDAAGKYISGVNVVVIVRTINSRKVFVTGRVTSPGSFPLMSALNVMQAITLAGGLTEFADPKGVTILRTENGQQRTLSFNYQDVTRGKNLDQNVQLRPGDTIVVP